MTKLAVIYGPPLVGKSAVAQALAHSLPGKTALVSLDHLLYAAIVTPDSDAIAELEMVHIQLRLLVANYLKNKYHVVVEGQFIYERAGVLHNHEAEIGQLVALMRNLIDGSAIVRLAQPDKTLQERAAKLGREDGVASARRIDAAYRERFSRNFLNVDASLQDIDAIATEIRSALFLRAV